MTTCLIFCKFKSSIFFFANRTSCWFYCGNGWNFFFFQLSWVCKFLGLFVSFKFAERVSSNLYGKFEGFQLLMIPFLKCGNLIRFLVKFING